MGTREISILFLRKKIHLYTDHQALESLIKRNRSNKQYSARITRWLDRLTHFDISIQHIAGNDLKFTNYLSRNPVGGATPGESYDEEYVINILSEHAKLNIKYGPIIADQSKSEKAITETKKNTSEERNENRANKSQKNRTFENENNVNKHQRNIKTTSGQSEISEIERSHSTKEAKSLNHIQKIKKLNTEITEMDRENFYHWGATREIIEIICRRNNSPETHRLVEQRNQLSRPGTLRRRYDHYTQRTVFAPSRPNKRSREEIAEIDAEIMRRANRLGGGYQPMTEEQDEPEELQEEGELEIENTETEEDSVIMRGDNLPIVDLSKYNTDGKEAKYIQINHIVRKLTSNKKITEEHIKKAEFEFTMDLKTLIAKTAIDPELTRVRNSMRREDRETIPDGYWTVFDKLSIRWGLLFVDDQIVVPIDFRRKLLDIIHFGHSGITKMNAEAKVFWWPGMKQDIENKVNDCTACLASDKNLNYQLPKKHYGKLEKLTEPGQEIQIDFTGKLHNKSINGDAQILIAIDRFSKWPTVKICKSAETKEVINFLSSNFNLYGIPEKIESDKGGAFVSNEYQEFCKNRNIEIEYCTPPNAYGKRNSRKSNTNTEEFNYNKYGRQHKHNRKCKSSITRNAIYNTYRTENNTIRTTSR